MNRNAGTSLPRRRRASTMADFDRLPAPARAWVAQAVLPWSAHSVRRLWTRALAETGSEAKALSRLAAAERTMLARERSIPGRQPRQVNLAAR